MLYSLLLVATLTLPPADTIKFQSPQDIFSQAEIFEKNGEYDKAIDSYQTISENDTSYTEAASKLMIAYNNAKRYQECIDLGTKIFDTPSDFTNNIYLSLGNAYLNTGRFDEARKIYLFSLKKYPYNYILIYNIGLSYYKQEQYKEALPYFQKSAQINPYYASNHIMLGYLSTIQGHRTKAILSYLTSLAINPDNNGVLVFLEELAKNSMRVEGSVASFSDNSAFEKYDELLRSGAAFDKRYVRKVDFNSSIVKQVDLLLSKIRFDTQSDDFWTHFYIPFYTQLEQNQLSEAFTYFILQSTKNDEVINWLTDHKTLKSQWIDLAKSELQTKRLRDTATVLEVPDEYSFWFFSNNALSAIGNQVDNETRYGPWAFYSLNGQLNAIGKYSEVGKKIGQWKYYYDNGQLSREENYDDNGNFVNPAKYFHENGQLSIEVPYGDNKLDGTLKYYFECGELKKELSYSKGLKDGDAMLYYATGQKRLEYRHLKDSLHGPYTYFHKNEQINDAYIYKKDLLYGAFASFFSDGQLSIKGSYKADSIHGEWIEYFQNGKVKQQGAYEMDSQIGAWKYFHSNGQLNQESSYGANGKLHGANKIYDRAGHLFEINTFDNGRQTGYTYYDKDDNVIATAFDPDGNLRYESYDHNGRKRSEGMLVDGEIEGDFIKYFSNGEIELRTKQVANEYHGDYQEFYITGELKTQCTYNNGLLDGFYQSYFKNGQIEQEGWYVEGALEQKWVTYCADGLMEKEQYFISDEINGWVHYFAGNKKKQRAYKYDMGQLIGMSQYDSLGNKYHQQVYGNGTGARADLTVNGDTIFATQYKCGAFNTDLINYYPNGTVKTKYEMADNTYHGKYHHTSPLGMLLTEGKYLNGSKDGKWKWYYANGSVKSAYEYKYGENEGLGNKYYADGAISSVCEYEGDEKSGRCTYYDHNSNTQLVKFYSKKDGLISYLDNQTKDTIPFSNKGAFMIQTFFESGQKAATQNYFNGKIEGVSTFYNKSGTITETVEYKSGMNHGKWIVYHANGNVHISKSYSNDLLNGEYVEYRADGKKIRITNYHNGDENGLEKWFDSNGNVVSEILFWNGSIY